MAEVFVVTGPLDGHVALDCEPGAESNNDRGPVDCKLSARAHNKSLIEFQLARSTSLTRISRTRGPIYAKVNQLKNSAKVVLLKPTSPSRVLRPLGIERGPAAESVFFVSARGPHALCLA